VYELSMHVSHLPHSTREFIVYVHRNTKSHSKIPMELGIGRTGEKDVPDIAPPYSNSPISLDPKCALLSRVRRTRRS
jgi:hypothetical protein